MQPLGDGSRTGDGTQAADVEALTVGVGGRSGTVRSDEIIATLVAVLFLGFSECALHKLDTRCISYFSHN